MRLSRLETRGSKATKYNYAAEHSLFENSFYKFYWTYIDEAGGLDAMPMRIRA